LEKSHIHLKHYTMPRKTQRQRREKQSRCDCECGICFDSIKPKEELRLPCNHIYHVNCISKWGNRKTPDGEMEVIVPCEGTRKIALFKTDVNIFTCPECRTEYTHDVLDNFKVKKVLAKIHLIHEGEPVAQYITHPLQTMAFVPRDDLIDTETKINRRWIIQLALLKKAWERGDKDIYAMKRLSPEPEFVLTNKHLNLCPLNKDGTTKQIPNRTLMTYEMVSVEELVRIIG